MGDNVYNVNMSTTPSTAGSSAAPAAAGKSPLEMLNTPVQFLKGVGPARMELLARLDLHYARDLLFFLAQLVRAASLTELHVTHCVS